KSFFASTQRRSFATGSNSTGRNLMANTSRSRRSSSVAAGKCMSHFGRNSHETKRIRGAVPSPIHRADQYPIDPRKLLCDSNDTTRAFRKRAQGDPEQEA